MPEKKKDVFVIYEELKNRMLGVSDRNPKGMKGILVSFLPSGEPVNSKDFKHPWKPNMTSPNKVQPPPLPGEDPAIPDTSDIAKRYESLSNTCTLVDNKIRLNEIYQAIENSSTVSQTWELIINAANVIPMDPAQEAFQKRQFKKYFPRLRKTKIDEDGEPFFEEYDMCEEDLNDLYDYDKLIDEINKRKRIINDFI
jgi:hypothetical protein